MNIKERLQQIEERKKEIRSILGTDKTVDLDKLETELRDLQKEKEELEKRQLLIDQAEQIDNGQIEARSLGTVNQILAPKNEKREQRTDLEKRGKDLKESRSITVGTSEIVLPQYTGDTINGTFNQISSLIDKVQHKPLTGGESFKQPFEKPMEKDADYTKMNGEYNQVETLTGYAPITKSKITAYQEEPEEVIKLPNADYDGLITKGTGKALRRKITKEILIGDGAADHLRGIFYNPTEKKEQVIDPTTDIVIDEINEDTLDEIIYSFGGDEDVEDVATLILNKKDLKLFAMVKDKTGKKVYDIKNNGNTGTIDNVPYIINTACKDIKNAKENDYCMAYGPLSNYMLTTFSETEIQRSTDFKFKQGMIAHKGVVFVGGNVVAYNGFIRVKKGTKKTK